MNKSILIVFMLIGFVSHAQKDVPDFHWNVVWQEGDTREFYGHQISKLVDQYPRSAQTYQYRPITSIAWQSLEQLIQNTCDSLPNDSSLRQKALDSLQNNSPGGALEIYLSRYNDSRANFRFYFIIIRDSTDRQKLYEADLPYQAPEIPYERGWWNFIRLPIPVALEPPFYVYLNEKDSRYLTDFKFLVD